VNLSDDEELFEPGDIVRWRREYYRVRERRRFSGVAAEDTPTFVYTLDYIRDVDGSTKRSGFPVRHGAWPFDLERPEVMVILALEAL
jgi:uncharacterized Fe-S cluster-containing radical SAM superfamily protein